MVALIWEGYFEKNIFPILKASLGDSVRLILCLSYQQQTMVQCQSLGTLRLTSSWFQGSKGRISCSQGS